MSTWSAFSLEAPQLAAFGAKRFSSGVAYLATIRPDGGPRVHPVTPILGEQLYLFMEPTSPKGKDLQRDGRYALHCAVEDSGGGGGEFLVRGQARLSSDPGERAAAEAAATYEVADRYVLFALSVEFALMNTYGEAPSFPRRWIASETTP